MSDKSNFVDEQDQCRLCGRRYFHRHSAEEVVIFNNGVKDGCRSESLKHSVFVDESTGERYKFVLSDYGAPFFANGTLDKGYRRTGTLQPVGG